MGEPNKIHHRPLDCIQKLLTVKEKKPEYVKEMETGQLNNNCQRGDFAENKSQ